MLVSIWAVYTPKMRDTMHLRLCLRSVLCPETSWGSLQRSPEPIPGGERARCPSPTPRELPVPPEEPRHARGHLGLNIRGTFCSPWKPCPQIFRRRTATTLLPTIGCEGNLPTRHFSPRCFRPPLSFVCSLCMSCTSCRFTIRYTQSSVEKGKFTESPEAGC